MTTDREFHDRIDPHRRGGRLSDVILGGQDGVVNTLGVLLGVAAASHETRVVMAAGLAAALAESLSMAAVAFTSARARRAHFESERRREHRHIARVPALERDEVREIFRAKGFDGELLDRIVARITADPDVWVAVMLSDELELAPTPPGEEQRAAVVVGTAAIVGSLVPLVPFLLLPLAVATVGAVVVSALLLFGTGVYQARTTVGHWLARGIELASIGIATALAGYFIGRLFG